MNLLSRLALATVIVCAGFAVLFWTLLEQGRTDLRSLTRDLANERTARFDTASRLQGAGLEALVSSYAWWNDMVRYMDQPDEKWAADTVDNIVGIPNGGDAVWIIDPDLKLIHTIDKDYRHIPLPFASPEQFRHAATDRYTFRYFAFVEGALWEIYVAAIQDAKFWRHQTPIRGYLLLGKRWDDAWISQFNTLIGAHLTVYAPNAALPETQPLHEFRRTLQGLDGRPLAILDARFNFDLLETARQAFIRRFAYLSIVSLAALLALFAASALLVLRPLGRIARSLESRQPHALSGLLSDRSELGEVARLVAGQLRWGLMLQEELRRHLESSQPDFARRNAEANEALRLRIAGNLHDGPIQTIYAAGLQLSAVQLEAEKGRVPDPRKVTSVVATLQQATIDLRNLILELEPEELRERDLEAALQQIERQMCELARCDFTLSIGEGALDGLSRDVQTHLYFICRELTSNALRHARPAHASLRFSLRNGFLELEWRNDGAVAAPDPASGGHGLRSIERRVAELGGTVRLGPRDGQWQVVCEIPCTSFHAPGGFAV